MDKVFAAKLSLLHPRIPQGLLQQAREGNRLSWPSVSSRLGPESPWLQELPLVQAYEANKKEELLVDYLKLLKTLPTQFATRESAVKSSHTYSRHNASLGEDQ